MIMIDAEMPKTCSDCPLWQGSYGCPIVEGIPAWQKEISEKGMVERSEHCPMQETEVKA